MPLTLHLLAQLSPAVDTARNIGALGPTALLALACLGLLAALSWSVKLMSDMGKEHRKEAHDAAEKHKSDVALLATQISTLQSERLKDIGGLYEDRIEDIGSLKDAALAMSNVPPAMAAAHDATRAIVKSESDRVIHAITDLGRGLHDGTRSVVTTSSERVHDAVRASSSGTRPKGSQ